MCQQYTVKHSFSGVLGQHPVLYNTIISHLWLTLKRHLMFCRRSRSCTMPMICSLFRGLSFCSAFTCRAAFPLPPCNVCKTQHPPPPASTLSHTLKSIKVVWKCILEGRLLVILVTMATRLTHAAAICTVDDALPRVCGKFQHGLVCSGSQKLVRPPQHRQE